MKQALNRLLATNQNDSRRSRRVSMNAFLREKTAAGSKRKHIFSWVRPINVSVGDARTFPGHMLSAEQRDNLDKVYNYYSPLGIL